MYVDKLDGKIDDGMFERFSGQWWQEQDRCLREIARLQEADQSYLDEGIALLEMARDARKMFEIQTAGEKRRLLNFVCSNSTWADGKLQSTFRLI